MRAGRRRTGRLVAGALPIDAVPDITNNQVQINTVAPALSPAEIEKQVTFRIETALAGIPGLESTRSLSRNGFSQVTAVFTERTDIYFARQQVNERLLECARSLPPGVEPKMGPVSTGLGEIYMWTVDYAPAQRPRRAAGLAARRRYLTPEGERLTTELERAAYLRTVQDWIIRPQIKSVPGVAGVDAIGGYVKQYHVQPDPAKLIALGLSFADVVTRHRSQQRQPRRQHHRAQRRGRSWCAPAAGSRHWPRSATSSSARAAACRSASRDIASVDDRRRNAHRQRQRERPGSRGRHRVDADRRQQPHGGGGGRCQDRTRSAGTLPAGIGVKTVLNRTQLVDATIATVATNLAEGALLVIVVLFLLLGNFRAALITALVIPLAMLMTATGMLQGRISANLMSLGALDFGLIVDGAVIITENACAIWPSGRRAAGRLLTLSERLETVQASAEEMIGPASTARRSSSWSMCRC